MSDIRLQAHRGVSTDYPENTIPAFQASVDMGYKVIELDAKYTKDGVCVLHHDLTINRTGRTKDGESLGEEKINIRDCDFEYLRTLDFGLWMGEEFRGTLIPTLDEVLEFFRQNDIPSKFDNIWHTKHFTEEQQLDFLTKLAQAGLGKKLGITCANLDALKKALSILPAECEVHWDGAFDADTLAKVAELAQGHRLTVWTCCLNDQTIKWYKGETGSAEATERIHAIGAEVGVWILHREEELDYAINVCKANTIETTGGIKPPMLEKFN